MSEEYKTVKLKLDGKQSLSVPVDIKKNGRYITEDVDIIVRGFLKFNDEATTDTTLYESNSYQRQSANKLDDKTVVHPVLFVSNRIRVLNGRGVFTLLPRSEDVLEDTETVQDRAGSDITDDQIVSSGGISKDEQITEPNSDPATIIIETGEIRTPYKISIEITIVPLVAGGLYAQTIDRGTNPTVDDDTSDSSLFSKYKTRTSSNLVVECFGEDDWVPVITPILGTNNSSYDTFVSELEDLSNSTPMGASTLYDAIVSGADIVSDNEIDTSRKIIYTFTDNESSASTASADNVINEVNNIDGVKNTPLMIANMAIVEPVTLSVKANTTDTRDLNKMSFETGGQAVTVVSEDFLDDIVGIFYSEAVGAMGYGTYEFIADLGEESTVNNITAYFDITVDNASATWEIETSIDGYNYTALNKDYVADETVEFADLLARYIKFKIILITGFIDTTTPSPSIFPDSPALTSISIVYNQANIAYLYLNKEEEDIIPYHITLAVDSNEIANNEISVGVAKSDSGTWADYSTPSQSIVNQNGKIVIPIRFSQDIGEFQQEPLNKVDSFTLKMEYGSFDPFATVLLYDKDDEIITSDKYKLYPRDGVVVLSFAVDTDYQDGDFKIGLLNGTDYKVGLKLTNKSDSEQLLLYGVGYLYTTGRDLLPPVTKIPPEASNVIITNENPNRFTIMEVSYTYTDSNFDPEDESATRIIWYINGSSIDYLEGVRKWNDTTDPLDPVYSQTSLEYPDSDDLTGDTIDVWIKKQEDSILQVNDAIYYEVQVSDGELFGVKEKSSTVKVTEAIPVLKSQIFVKAKDENGNIGDRLSADKIAVIYPSLDEIFAGDGEDVSEIQWIINDVSFKSGIVGDVSSSGIPIEEIRINEIGNEEYTDYGLRINNSVTVQVTPRTSGVVGEIITSRTVIVENSLPRVYNVEFVGSSHSDRNDLVLSWDWWNFESIALADTDTTGQKDVTTVSWFVKNPGDDNFTEIYRFNDQTNNLEETFIDPFYNGKITISLINHNSIISSSVLFVGQKWQCVITPNDTIDNGTTYTTEEITITASAN